MFLSLGFELSLCFTATVKLLKSLEAVKVTCEVMRLQ